MAVREQSSVPGGELQRPVNWGSLCFEGAKEKEKGMRKETRGGTNSPSVNPEKVNFPELDFSRASPKI